MGPGEVVYSLLEGGKDLEETEENQDGVNRIRKEWNISIEGKMETIGETWGIGVGVIMGEKREGKKEVDHERWGGERRQVSPDE